MRKLRTRIGQCIAGQYVRRVHPPGSMRPGAWIAALLLCLVLPSVSAGITVLNPVGGETYYVGDTMDIRWSGGSNVRVWLCHTPSPSGWGKELGHELPGVFLWVVPEWAVDEECYIVVTEMMNCMANHDFSGAFAIRTRPASNDISLQFPLGGELFSIGDTVEIRWTGGEIRGVDIRLSVDGGATWARIHRIFGSDSLWGHYPWVIPSRPRDVDADTVIAIPSPSCRIEVAEVGSRDRNNDQSTDFTIQSSGTAAVLSPHAGSAERQKLRGHTHGKLGAEMQSTAAVHDCAGRRLGVAVAGRSGVRIITKIGAGVCVARRAIALESSCNSFCIAHEGTSAIEGMCR